MTMFQNLAIQSLLKFAILTLLSTGGSGQLCQQSLPSQYDPTSDSSTTTSNHITFYLYPDFFNATQCTGLTTSADIEYQFCYLFNQNQGPRETVFTVFILGDEDSVYRVLDSYTEREDRNVCPTMSNTCCKTVSRAVTLNVQRGLALGFVIPDVTGGTNLYASNTVMSPGFAVPSYVVQNTDVGSTIDKAGFSGVRSLVNNRRFRVSFATGSLTMATTTTDLSPATTTAADATTTEITSPAEITKLLIWTVLPIAGIVTIVLLITVVIIFVLQWQKRKNKKSMNQLTTQAELNNDSDHMLIDGANNVERSSRDENSTIQQPWEHVHPQHANDTTSIFTKSNEAYATNIVAENNVAYTTAIVNDYLSVISSGENFDESNQIEQDAYVVPASDESSLFNQFSKIKIQTLHRGVVSTTEQLGSGQFGTVHKGEWMASEGGEKIEVAVKTLKEGASEEDKVKFLQEAAIMGQFSHPNVVKLYGVVTEGEPIMLILELLPKGDLCHVLRETNFVDADLPHTLLSFCRQVASGMSYLSNKVFVHRDLAARNILVSEEETCKIADFGMSRDLADTNYYISHGGKIPVKWTAPEAIHYNKYSTASDVWSFGCVMYEIWSLGHIPFEEHTNTECIMIIYDKGIRLAPPPGCPRVVYKLMMDCWHPESSSRPDFVSVVQQLSLPDTKLLKWSEEDKATDPEAATLGAGLDKAVDLYKDFQERYYMH